MNRTLINFILNVILLVAFLAVFWTTTVLHFVFPPGPNALGWTLWGASYVEWRGVQFALVASLAMGILLHVMLHWSWVCGVISTKLFRTKGRPDEGLQTVYGVATLIVLLLLLGGTAAAAFLTIRRPETKPRTVEIRTHFPNCRLSDPARFSIARLA